MVLCRILNIFGHNKQPDNAEPDLNSPLIEILGFKSIGLCFLVRTVCLGQFRAGSPSELYRNWFNCAQPSQSHVIMSPKHVRTSL